MIATFVSCSGLQPFSQKSHTPTVAKELQIGHYAPQRPIWNTFGTVAVRDFWENGCIPDRDPLLIQPFSQKPRTPTVTQLLRIGLHGVAEADL